MPKTMSERHWYTHASPLSRNAVHTNVGCINPDLYSETLTEFCSANSKLAKASQLRMQADQVQRQLTNAVREDKLQNPEKFVCDVDISSARSEEVWHSQKLYTQYNGALDHAKKDYFHYEEAETIEDWTMADLKAANADPDAQVTGKAQTGLGCQAADSGILVNQAEQEKLSYCYLCSTLEEHRAHLKSEKRMNGQTRIPYYNPVKPENLVPRQPDIESMDPEGDRAIYKVVVKTGDNMSSGTDAKATIRLYGMSKYEKSRIIPLKKPGLFKFMRGSKNQFSINTIHIPEISAIKIESDGVLKDQAWFIEWMEITNMKDKKVYYFPCNEWLVMADGQSLSRILNPDQRKTVMREYTVSVLTGAQVHSGIDSRVYLTLIGSSGKRSKRFHLRKPDGGHNFRRGALDTFSNIKATDVGRLVKIRIEHDSRGKSKRWLLNLVHIKDVHDKTQHLFYCNQWLVNEEGNAAWRELNSSKVPKGFQLGALGQVQDGDVLYEVIIKTGDKAMSGTDANVFVQFHGDKKSSKVIQLTEIRGNYEDPFERNQSDTFQLKCPDVGEVRKLRVGHDASGVAPGWYCEHILLRKFIDITERVEVQDDEKQKFRRLTEIKSESEDESEIDSDHSESDNHVIGRNKTIKKKQSKTAEEIHSLTSRLLENTLSDSDKDLDETATYNQKMQSRPGSKKNSKGHSRELTSPILSDLTEDEESSAATSVWDSEELVSNEKQAQKDINKAINLMKREQKISKYLEKVSAKVEEYKFLINSWFSKDEGDQRIDRTFHVTEHNSYNRR